MTYSMLASIVKYPFASSLAGNHGKFGFFASKRNLTGKLPMNWAFPASLHRVSLSNTPAIHSFIW